MFFSGTAGGVGRIRHLFCSALWKILYLDNGTIFGNLELLEQALLRLEQNLPEFGLELNLLKWVLVLVSAPRSWPIGPLHRGCTCGHSLLFSNRIIIASNNRLRVV